MNSRRDDWEMHWNAYADSARLNPAQQMRHEFIIRLLRREVHNASRILDAGSGQGDLLVRLRRCFPDIKLAGVELSNQGAAISRKKCPSANVFAADMLNPGTDLNALNRWATHVICSEVLEHLDEPVSFLEALHRFSTHSSKLIITVPGGPMSAFDTHIGHRRHFTRQSLSSVVDDGGYRVMRVYRSGFPFFNLYRMAVIARGHRLAADIRNKPSVGAWVAMGIFRALFALNLSDSPFGWQLVCLAQRD